MQAVIVVGDVDVDAVEGKIKSIFADIPAAVNPKAKEKIQFKEFTEPRVAVITDPRPLRRPLRWLGKRGKGRGSKFHFGRPYDGSDRKRCSVRNERAF